METTMIYRGYIGIMENEMETTIICWGYTEVKPSGFKSTKDWL